MELNSISRKQHNSYVGKGSEQTVFFFEVSKNEVEIEFIYVTLVVLELAI